MIIPALLFLMEPAYDYYSWRKMVDKIIRKLKSEEANAIVENVIVMPLIFIIIYSLIMNCFMIHDKSTLQAAAKRGALYAAHCISDPNYANILRGSGSESGVLDTSINLNIEGNKFVFTGMGDNIEAYRYLTSSTADIDAQVEAEIKNIITQTRIPWKELKVEDIDFACKNMVLYQDVTVTLKADYPIPKFFSDYGMDSEYEFSVTAKMTVNDPDEFIRNADLVVDLIVDIDNTTTGGKLQQTAQKAVGKISDLATKLLEWIEIGQ